jgi:ABC-2 type transport system permease protein
MGGFVIALLWCVTAVLWYAPVIGYLMLASAWAPKAPFLWAVLPPVAIWVLERVVLSSEYAGDFITDRLFGLYRLLGSRRDSGDFDGGDAGEQISRLSDVDLVAGLRDVYTSPDLWLGVVAAAAMLAAAVWVRRYRDETS